MPAFPRIDFRCGSLLSFCVYGLLETPRLLATPRPYGNRRSVLAWSGWFRHLTYATSCRTSGLRTSSRLHADTPLATLHLKLLCATAAPTDAPEEVLHGPARPSRAAPDRVGGSLK